MKKQGHSYSKTTNKHDSALLNSFFKL